MAPKWLMSVSFTISRSQLFSPWKPITKTDAIVLTLLHTLAPSRLARFSLRSIADLRLVVMTTFLPYDPFTTHVVLPQPGTPLTHVITDTSQSSRASSKALRFVTVFTI
ncbi:hypothetical protein EVAR_23778_1 [Eumeta japonica]|uniref:Uncharacterized protein n=1 Tax=Eumeta variegata TaxID=151549 RepID=A0A4C1VF38_EUMVA|nr:hypothetical protein EVAR_23778_1 [Eumeta japonica]